MHLSTAGPECPLINALQAGKLRKSVPSYQSHMLGDICRFPEKWATLTNEAYDTYMTLKKLSYYLHDAKVTIKCDYAPLCKLLTTHVVL